MTRESRILLASIVISTVVIVMAQYYFTAQVLGFNALTAKALDQGVKTTVDQALATPTASPEASASVKASAKLKTASPSATPKSTSPSEEETAKPSPTE